MADSPRRILIVRLRQIGDVVFTTPAVQALREHFPSAHISYLVEPAAAPIVATSPHIDDVIVAPNAHGISGWRGDLVLGRQLRQQQFDLAIDFHGGPRASLLTWLSRAPVRIGYTIVGRSWMYTIQIARPRALRPRHSVVNQWDLLLPLGIPPPSPERYPIEMATDQASAERVEQRLSEAGVTTGDNLVVMHVSAGNPFRRWPADYFSKTAVALVRADASRRIVITSGPSDAAAAASVISAAQQALAGERERVLDCGEFSLGELRALVDRASLYIGGDSGPMHIASASHVPIVGLYGPTLPARSSPWRPGMWPSESVDAGDLPCRPCDQRSCLPGDFRCLTRIQPEDVLRAATRVLDRASGKM